MPITVPIPAAEYLRMSSDTQEVSLVYQSRASADFAKKHGFTIVRSYQDPGRSGLTLNHRPGLARLLQDVVSPPQPFEAILVYDVSRSGRFQDTDEAAHYEFVCRSAGTPVYYCAEAFKNTSSPANAIMKTLKRIMAAEYSRELSERLIRTKVILTEKGFRVGGLAGYGLRRLLVSGDRLPKRILEFGERKGVTGRVVLIPGAAKDVARVREMYRMKISERKTAGAIARELNRRGWLRDGRPWKGDLVLEILRNPKYAGWAVWGRTRCRLGAKLVNVPQLEWTINRAAFQGLIGTAAFEAAQEALRDRTCNKSNEELLSGLRTLLKQKGKLSGYLIDLCREIPASATYIYRFGSLRKTYAQIGYSAFKNVEGMKKMRARHRNIGLALRARVARILKNDVRIVGSGGDPDAGGNGCRRMLCFRNRIRMSVLLCQCVRVTSGALRWRVPVNKFERSYPTLVCRCTPNNGAIKDMYLFRSIVTSRTSSFRIKENDAWLKTGHRITDLSKLPQILNRYPITSYAIQKLSKR
jgi:DNA invertase Pin-like site-specific DNA recombinase